MASKKKNNQKSKKDMSIPNSATVIPGSNQEHEQKRGNQGVESQERNDSTQSSF